MFAITENDFENKVFDACRSVAFNAGRQFFGVIHGDDGL